MKVKLLSYTPVPIELIAKAGKTCYSAKPPSEIIMTQAQALHQLEIIHGSCFEHVNFTFEIEGISRVASHQLVRHRHASFSQQSMRYVDVHKLWNEIVIPDSVKEIIEDEEMLGENYSDEPMLQAIDKYKFALEDLIKELDKHKIPSEDIRYFVPMGVKTNLVCTMNMRELQHVLGLRMCKRAQDEIREVANRMYSEVCAAVPEFARFLGPQCEQLGYCPEHKPCGKYPPLDIIREKAGIIRSESEVVKTEEDRMKGWRKVPKEEMPGSCRKHLEYDPPGVSECHAKPQRG